MARQFISRGYEKVLALKGGWDEWEKAKLPVEPKESPRSGGLKFLNLVEAG